MKSAALGAIAGLVATVPMSAWMWFASKRGWLVEQAPQTVTRRSSQQATGRKPAAQKLDVLTTAVHLGIGGALGALFGVLVGRRTPGAVASTVVGVGYGLFVWVASYAALLPAVDLMPPPSSDHRRRPQVMVVAHVIFGSVLGALVSVARRSVR